MSLKCGIIGVMLLLIQIILLVIKYGPTIIALVKEIWDLIKKQPLPLQPKYKAELLEACKMMSSNKIKGSNALYDLKAKLQNA